MGFLDGFDASQQRIADRQMEASRILHVLNKTTVAGPNGVPVLIQVRRGVWRGTWVCLATPQVGGGRRQRYKGRWESEDEAAWDAVRVVEDIRSGARVFASPGLKKPSHQG
ncbi:hypothetical protein GCM10009839_78050 [Catenulispora yoronensis]|uniref:AP2/ERF domain-containing protein n=1 Tax=Catenulispora yoronensis TaxID=450799 RepID=A0ABN2VAH1_9ACTN